MATEEITATRNIENLNGDMIELCVHFRGGGHVDVVGRVRVISGNVWVGSCCLPVGTIVKRPMSACPRDVWTVYNI